jgi:SSS family solute:Na+ symporter
MSDFVSHFGLLDGGIVGLYLLATMVAGIMVRKYVGGVEDFLVAGREMNVYLGIASLAATEFGIVTCMYSSQAGYKYGFAGAFPGIVNFLAMLIVGWTGFCVKPLRDSNVITIPELLDKRFGPRVRWATGVVIVLGGLLNMGVFLRVGGQFLISVTGLESINLGTGVLEHYKLEIMMTVLLVGVATYTVLGGMLSVLVTDFLQFVVMSAGLLVVTVMILWQIGWTKIVGTVEHHYGDAGFNPLLNPELGWDFVIFNMFLNTAAVLTWQTAIARVLAAKDTNTGRKVYTRTSFFFLCRWIIPVLWGIAALSMFPDLKGPEETLQAMPRFLSAFIPMGIMGILVAAMLAADMSTDSSYMLTWGGVIYNDVLAPFRRGQRWSERKGLFWNRSIVAMIGVFLLFYGLWYPLKGDLWSYLAVTGSIYLASISTLLIACCYWSRANNWGATAAICVGAIIPVSYLVAEQVLGAKGLPKWINSNYAGIAAYLCTGLAMIVGSLLKPQSAPQQKESLPC